MTQQLGFDSLLSSADRINAERVFECETGHLPSTMTEALPFYRDLMIRHDIAMTGGDIDEALWLRHEAHKLAVRLNGGAPGILADDDAPGCLLTDQTQAPFGTVPLWGQQGDFIVTVGLMRVRIEMDGMFGIGSGSNPWPGFAAHAVDENKPFLSETGYRSFLGLHTEYIPGLTPETFVAGILAGYVKRALRGRLVAVDQQWRSRNA